MTHEEIVTMTLCYKDCGSVPNDKATTHVSVKNKEKRIANSEPNKIPTYL